MAETMQIWPAFQVGYLNWLSQILSPIWRSWKAENIFPWYPQSWASGCELVLPLRCIHERFGKWKEGNSTLPSFHGASGQ